MLSYTTPIEEPVLEQRAPLFELLRCHCPECLRLDAQYPGQGYQLSLLRFIELGFQA